MKPRWMGRNWSCPNCGFVYRDEDHVALCTTSGTRKTIGTWNLKDKHVPISVKCPNCGDHRSYEDFSREQALKWGDEHEEFTSE